MKDTESDLNQRIAERVHDERVKQGLSLDALAAQSGVSRSMISLIERGETSATAVVLERLASGLNITLASLFDAPASTTAKPRAPISRRDDQPVWVDPESGYRRRNVTPSWVPQPMQIVEVEFPPGQHVAFDAGPRGMSTYQQIWIQEGRMEITVGEQRHCLRTDDCLAMQLGEPTMFHNPTKKTTRYVVVIARDPTWKRS